MIPLGAELPLTIRKLIPWLALGHGIFNTLMMLLFCYQGWLGHVVRRHRLADTPVPLSVVRKHRWQGPWLAILGWAGFMAGSLIVLADKGEMAVYPLHFSLGLAIVLTLTGAWVVSQRIKVGEPTGRSGHRFFGILLLCLYPVQAVVGLGILL